MKKAILLLCFHILCGLATLGLAEEKPLSQKEYREEFCHYDGGFKLGMNAALAGQPMASSISKHCASKSRPEIERGYREGYTQGLTIQAGKASVPSSTTPISPAPTAHSDSEQAEKTKDVDAGINTASAPPTPHSNLCQENAQCPGGQFCKPRADQMKVCMGDGRHGDYCQANIDCRQPGFCRNPGDGILRCMHMGPKGGFCANSTDCDAGLMCRAESTSLTKHCQ